MRLGIALPHYDISFPDQQPATFDRVAGYAGRAESAGFHQLWVSDHFWLDLERYGGPAGRQGTPECWTTLSALAVRTSRVRLGSLVLAAGFRPPTLLAKMAATLDQLAGGRLDLGLGAGWNEAEFTENGLPFPRPGERLAMLEEALGVLRENRRRANRVTFLLAPDGTISYYLTATGGQANLQLGTADDAADGVDDPRLLGTVEGQHQLRRGRCGGCGLRLQELLSIR